MHKQTCPTYPQSFFLEQVMEQNPGELADLVSPGRLAFKIELGRPGGYRLQVVKVTLLALRLKRSRVQFPTVPFQITTLESCSHTRASVSRSSIIWYRSRVSDIRDPRARKIWHCTGHASQTSGLLTCGLKAKSREMSTPAWCMAHFVFRQIDY